MSRYEYGPFGEVFCSVGDMAKVNPFQFSTKYTDNETDLVYYGYRYYSPALGRWLSRDPIEEQGGLNLYGFVNNDPVNAYDILGLWKIERERKRWAIATAEVGDTFDGLGRLLNLDTEDYKAWAHTGDDYAIPGCTYYIPNTIYIDIGVLNGLFEEYPHTIFSAWKRTYRKAATELTQENFLVLENYNVVGSTIKEEHLPDPYLYGYIYIGHGSLGAVIGSEELPGFEGEESEGVGPGRYTKHGIAFMLLNGCYTADRPPMAKSIADSVKYNAWE
ncbi:MAG: RHS repeat-associated core domain-containing protein [Parabacteroides sp.]|nr:RHS repeat-associated core domain-containing protein [Parabacteroides sp.]